MLANLPIELLIKVLDDLDAFTLSSCRFVSRPLNNVIKSSSLLQYKLELGFAGVEPNPTCALGLSECLESARSYRRDWENLAWSFAGGWQQAIGNVSHSQGTFILGEVIMREDDDPEFRLRTRRFQPKSKHRRLEERTWSEDRPAVTFGGIDPSQDLLFAMPDEGDIHILSLSTFKPHPDAAYPTIHIPVGQDSSVEIDICGPRFVASTHLGHSFRYEESIRVCDWRTGRMLAEISYACDDFFLLTEEFVACYVIGRGPTDHPSHFAIFRITTPGSPSHHGQDPLMRTPFCVFNLPHPTGGKSWYPTQGRMDGGHRTSPPPKNSSVPFYSSGKRHLLCLWLLQSLAPWRNPDCSLVIPVQTLLRHIPLKPASSTTVFDWDAWGPAGSRLLKGVEAWQIFGWKIAQVGPLDVSTTPQGISKEVGITVYDFNPLPFHGPLGVIESGRKESKAEFGERSRKTVTSPSTCPDSVELDGVHTSLPYRVTSASFEIRGDPTHYEISLGEDGMIVWTHHTLDYVVLTI